MSSPTRFCKHCGAQISANAQFCKACGKSVATQPAPMPTEPPQRLAAQAGASRPTWLIAGCVAVVAIIACVAVVAVGGFFFFQSNAQTRATPTLIAIISPSTPTRAPNTVVAPPTLPAPAITPTTAPTSTPTTAPSPTPSPTPKCPPTPALPAGVLFSDNFGSRQVFECNGWDLEPEEDVDRTWSANKYTILVKKKNWIGFNWPSGEYDNFGAETQAQPVGAGGYGLVFRLSGKADARSGETDARSYYFFRINTDGRYRLDKSVVGNWVSPTLVDWTASSAIKPGGAPNTIGVIAQGGALSLYINRVLVKTITDSSPLSKGYVGLAAVNLDNDRTEVAFSQLTILTPDKALADWGGASAPAAPPVVSSSPQPQIVSLEFPSEIAANGTKYDGLVRFRDDGGDIARIAFDPAFIQPQGFNYGPFGFEFTNPAVRWVEGNATSTSGAFRFSNSCTGDTLIVTYTATLYDKAGNKSAPYPFSFLCKGNAFVVFFTIQNGSPTGYVIDKQGVKHAAPAYLTISNLHVAPGDRVVLQTDQPRFSLLFDCGTTPKMFTPCDFVADSPASLPGWVTKNTNGSAYLNISRADNWAGTRPGFPTQRYPADPVLRIGLGD